MSNTHLFSPISIGNNTLRNRIVMPPMCQYSAKERGLVTDYHLAHYGARSLGGVGLVIVEATAIEADGRISFADLGIWSEEQESGLAQLAWSISHHGAVAGIQIAHAGRKAAQGVERRAAPSALAFSPQHETPLELTLDEIRALAATFAMAAARAVRCGFKVIEIHAAHGYLLHEFLSPLSNMRCDEYGGAMSNRLRFLLEVVASCKEHIPPDVCLSVRLSGSEYSSAGYTKEDIKNVCAVLYGAGIGMIHMSSGGNLPLQPEVWPGYQLPLARIAKSAVPVPIIGVGLLKSPEMAEFALREKYCDLVAIGRGLLHDPHWAIKAASNLGAPLPVSESMARGLQR
ncbi:MAG: NADPH dehydrogenase [Peptococcaceae bacterium]|nr:NADPH dehydrogenase [Peptococcaceae bacterium]